MGPRVAPTPWRLGQAREIPVSYAGATPDIRGKRVVGREGVRGEMDGSSLSMDEMELCVAGQILVGLRLASSAQELILNVGRRADGRTDWNSVQLV